MTDNIGLGPRPDLTAGPTNPWLHRFAVVVMVATFVLIVAGGNVTSKDAGMAVPDWPLSFGSVNPEGWTGMPGVRDEHGHRLIGASVGVLVTALAIWLAVGDPRRWVKWMGLAAWLAVVVQGLMGGLRVTENSISLAIVHGCFAQAFFCLTVAIVAVTSPHWPTPRGQAGERPPGVSPADERALRWSTGGLVGAVFVQLILGALIRHTGSTWVPHVGWAVVVGLALMTAARYVFTHAEAKRTLAGPMIGLLLLYGIQLILGLATLIVVYSMASSQPQSLTQAALPTIHTAMGAAILGVAAFLAVRSYGLTATTVNEAASAELRGVPA